MVEMPEGYWKRLATKYSDVMKIKNFVTPDDMGLSEEERTSLEEARGNYNRTQEVCLERTIEQQLFMSIVEDILEPIRNARRYVDKYAKKHVGDLLAGEINKLVGDERRILAVYFTYEVGNMTTCYDFASIIFDCIQLKAYPNSALKKEE
ncbi:MAG TPA: hypothetical protein VN420_03555 [Candidatus Fimivivens sp.]|nr:hypothetical protein [Candidatus Fimivivens sp.]